ncbi:MAG: hypothetical protein U9O18_04035 [Chloroflexota bacterium]|nr:hypothetical protein [Chloroflexota bacterium]
MSNSRTRMAAIAGSLALSLSMVSAPAVLAQDGPEATIEGLMAAIEAKDFESLPSFFCAEFADEMGGLGFGDMTEGMPPGTDVDTLLDAFIFDVEIASTEVLSQTDTEAIVQLEGSMSMDINVDALGPFIDAMLEMSGMEVTPENTEMFTDVMLSGFEAEETDISEEITLVPGEAMPWLVCSELGGDDLEDDMVDDGMDDMADDDMIDEDDGE